MEHFKRQSRASILVAVSQADTLCFFFCDRGSGVLPEPAMRVASSSQLAGLWTAACDAGFARIPAVFGLPFDTLKSDFFFFAIMAERDIVGAALLLCPLTFTLHSLLV